jgi:hypothetical protein
MAFYDLRVSLRPMSNCVEDFPADALLKPRGSVGRETYNLVS